MEKTDSDRRENEYHPCPPDGMRKANETRECREDRRDQEDDRDSSSRKKAAGKRLYNIG